MLERTDAITNEVLEPVTFVLAYPTVLVKCGVILLFLIEQFYYRVFRTWLHWVVWIGMMSVSLSASTPTCLHLTSDVRRNLPLRSLRPAGAALNRYAVLQQSQQPGAQLLPHWCVSRELPGERTLQMPFTQESFLALQLCHVRRYMWCRRSVRTEQVTTDITREIVVISLFMLLSEQCK